MRACTLLTAGALLMALAPAACRADEEQADALTTRKAPGESEEAQAEALAAALGLQHEQVQRLEIRGRVRPGSGERIEIHIALLRLSEGLEVKRRRFASASHAEVFLEAFGETPARKHLRDPERPELVLTVEGEDIPAGLLQRAQAACVGLTGDALLPRDLGTLLGARSPAEPVVYSYEDRMPPDVPPAKGLRVVFPRLEVRRLTFESQADARNYHGNHVHAGRRWRVLDVRGDEVVLLEGDASSTRSARPARSTPCGGCAPPWASARSCR